MPPDNCFRLHDRDGVQNTRRDPIQADEDHGFGGKNGAPPINHPRLSRRQSFKVKLLGLSVEAEGLYALYIALAIVIPAMMATLVLLDRSQPRVLIPSAWQHSGREAGDD